MEKINLQKVCRLCISSDNITLIENVKLVEQEDPIIILSDFISAEDLSDVRLPQNICNVCVTFLNNYQHFKAKCKQNEELLKAQLEYSTSLPEPVELESDDGCGDNDSDDMPLLSRFQVNNAKKQPQSRKKNNPNGMCKQKKKFLCKYCAKSFSFKYKLVMHMRVHTKEKPFKCDICNLTFSFNGNLRRHKMTHTGEKPHVCDTCGKGFIQAKSLQIHQKKHDKDDLKHNYKCKICSRVFVRFIPFSLHIKKLHPNAPHPEVDENCLEINEKNDMVQFKCDICDSKFSKLIFLKRHKSRHGEKKFLCNDCGKGFVRKADLQSHFKIHTGEKPYVCHICNKSFAHSGSLVNHSLVHSGYKPYSCSICLKTFTQISHLKVHERTHSGERPFSCSFCEKTFALKSNLTVHVRIHTGETPFVCNICEKGFYDSSSMKKHRQSHYNLVDGNETTPNL